MKPELIMQWDKVFVQSYLLRGLQEKRYESSRKIITLVKQFRSCKKFEPPYKKFLIFPCERVYVSNLYLPCIRYIM